MPYLSNQTTAPDYRAFDLAGDHYTCGVVMGHSTQLRQLPGWTGGPAALAFARACADVVREHHPPLLEEYRGYADAQRRPWEDVLPHFSLNHPAGVAGGCSSAVWRLAGRTMVARNYDFAVNQRARHLIRSAPPGFQPILGTNASLIGGRYDGVNAAGLFAALHLVRSDWPERVRPGIPFHLVPRILLETCASAREAVERLLAMPLLHSFNYLLADSQDFFVVEAYPGIARVREDPHALVTTNHYQHPDMLGYQGRRRNSNSLGRANRLWEWLQEQEEIDWEWAQRMLADHNGPLCNHDRALSTLWAVVADLTSRRVAYCMGSPCRQPFQELPWPGAADDTRTNGNLDAAMHPPIE